MSDSITSPIWSKRCQQILEVSSAQPDADPVWVDISAYLLTVGSGQPALIARGRQTELDQAQPSQLTLALNNSDGRFTPDNPLSPYVSWWKQGRRIRLREKLGPWVFDLFDGYIQLPEVVIQVPGRDQVLNISAVDRIARLDQPGTEFVSTLTAHILGSDAAANLLAYWPLNEATGPTLNPLAGSATLSAITEVRALGSPTATPNTDGPGFAFAQGETIGADDSLTLLMSPPFDSIGIPLSAIYLNGAPDATISVASPNTIAAAIWVNTSTTAWSPTHLTQFIMDVETSSGDFFLLRNDAASQLLSAVVFSTSSGGVAEADGVLLTNDTSAWRLLTIRFTPSTGLLELWQGGRTPVTATMSPTGPLSLSTTLKFAQYFIGSVAHAQIYVGPSAFTYADHVAQMNVGLVAFERQKTGDRVDTLLDYAGVPSAQRDIDPGTAVMAATTLAGKTPRTALAEAEATERGLLFTDGTGRIVFRDRIRRYNL